MENKPNEYDNWYTPKTIAWKLYNDTSDDAMSSNILGFGPEGDADHLTYMFELLLAIFFEMLYQMMAIDNAKIIEERLESGYDLNIDEELIPDFEDFDMSLYLPIIENKFKRISHLVRIATYERYDENEKDYLIEVMKGRYCRVVLRYNDEDNYYFENSENSDDFDFIPNEGYQKKNKLRDIYAILKLNDKIYEIYFDEMKKIGTNIVDKMINF